MLLFCLISFWVHRSSLAQIAGKNMFSLALLACLLGDILLMFNKPEGLFYAGMGAFGLAHIFFFFYYLNQSQKGLNRGGMTLGLVFTIICCSILYFYYPLQGILSIAVFAYAFLFGLHLSWSAGVALAQKGGYLLSLLGAVLFMLSDMLLLYFKLHDFTDVWYHIVVMLTYGSGVYLITTGAVKQETGAL